LNNSLNQAIIIRSFFSKGGFLSFQAGAGIVINSTEDGELKEVNNKLDALRTALQRALTYDKF
jgi:anthranilate synthase component 1